MKSCPHPSLFKQPYPRGTFTTTYPKPQTEKWVGKKEEGQGGVAGKKKQEGREGGGEDQLHELCFLARTVYLCIHK